MSTSTSSSFNDDDIDTRPTFADFSATQIGELIYVAVRENGGVVCVLCSTRG